MAEHKCPCGCGRGIRADKLTCTPSWYALDAETRASVWSAYNRHGAGSIEHLRAVSVASRKVRDWGANQPGRAEQ